ncbi:MAG: GNAT family N-acetyltransferase [Paludibacteraceae bacterium]|nr:GNAT family N-acetyltransferase [Paludibacteraceae bacterium]
MANKRKIVFRADAGPTIGYGHYIRSLALADILKQDFDCTMFTQVPTDYQLRECEAVCPIVALPDDDSKFEKFLDYLHGDEIVVMDNYFFTTDYQRAIKTKGCQLVCIDDMHDKHYVADVVINHGCLDKSLFDVEPYTRLCLGMDYALLRRPFRNPKTCDRVPNSYAICFGGADAYNLTFEYAKELSIHDRTIFAIVGDSYSYEDTLKSLPNVEIRKRLSADAMASLFSSVENVICSASTTCYEALACGARVYAGWYVENQREIYHLLESNHQIVPLDNLREVKEIKQTTIEPVRFPKSYNALWRVFVQLAWRVVDYRDLTNGESRIIWEQRNREHIRKWMKNNQPIPLDIHCAFIESLKTNDTKRYYAFFLGDQFMASYDIVGIHDGQAECGLYLNAEYKGKGLASMVQSVMEQKAKEMGIHLLRSEVLSNNAASLQFFTQNGFVETHRDSEMVYMEKTI